MSEPPAQDQDKVAAWAAQRRQPTPYETRRAQYAQVIIDQGYCEGCGSKIKKRLAMRHGIACSVAHLNQGD